MSRERFLYAHDWRPRNLGGTIYHDPRQELAYWAASTADRDQEWVAVPVATLRAAAEVRECHATHLLRHDEDGELPKPLTIGCRKIEGHMGDHHNGYIGWPVVRDGGEQHG